MSAYCVPGILLVIFTFTISGNTYSSEEDIIPVIVIVIMLINSQRIYNSMVLGNFSESI